jgi:hypothetical protein
MLMDLATFFVAGPYVAVVVLLGIFYIKRARWRRRRGAGWKDVGFYPSASSLGNAMQNLQVFTRPTVAYVLEEKYDEDAEDDGDGGPEDPTEHLKRQLRRIRRGERVDTLRIRLR